MPPYDSHLAAGLLAILEHDPHLRDDPNEFIPFLFSLPDGRPFRQAAVHREMQDFLTAHSRALVELPRDHGKTTQLCGRLLWELARAPGLRVKVVCATDAVAHERGQFLRTLMTANERLRSLFPALTPGQPWAVDSFTVTRPRGVLGPSVAAFGIGAGSTGTRADLLVCDDVVDVKALHGKADRERALTDFRNNLLNLLEPDGRFWSLSTPWHRDDLNAHLKANPAYALFRRAVGENLEPVWPERWPREALAQRRDEIGLAAFARGYRLLPVDEGECAIPSKWVKTWQEPTPEFDRVIVAVDPAVSAAKRADATAVVVLGRANGVAYVLSATAYRVSTPELFPILTATDALWNPESISFEANAAFKGIADLMSRDPTFGHKVRPRPAAGSKEGRIGTLSVRIERGELLLKGDERGEIDPRQKELFDELISFPLDDHDDLADAVAAGTEVLLNAREPRVF
jgi:phage terminase large subunit-like protein